MNAPEVDSTLPPNPSDSTSDAEVKPKRKRAPRKTTGETEAAAAEVSVSDAPVPSKEAVFAPVKRAASTRRAAKAAVVLEAEPDSSPAVGETQPQTAAQRSRGDGGASEAMAQVHNSSQGDGSPAMAQAPVGAQTQSPTGMADQAATGGDGVGPQSGAEPSREAGQEAGEEGRGRRGRNRRRGRRGGEKGRAEGDALLADGNLTPPVVDEPLVQAGELFAQVLSGDFDVEPEAEVQVSDELSAEATSESAEAPRRVLAAEPDAPKLQKVLAQAGVGSRRDLEQWITEGRVTVNEEVAHTGQRISFGDRIQVDGKPVRYRIAPPPARVLAYHKPVGEVVSHDDPQQRPTVFRRLPRLAHGKWQSVGRLDINTEGLLLFTNSGELANQLMHPRFGVEREYAVRSLGVLAAESKARLLEGVEIDGQRASFKSIEDGGGEGVNHWYRVVITEGRNREVRRLFESVGHAVSRLIRIRYGSVVLPRGLKRGVWVDLEEMDMRQLRRLTQVPRVQAAPGGAEQGPRPPAPEGEGDRGDRGGRHGRNRRGRGACRGGRGARHRR